MLRPVDATAPVTGARSTTRSAATFTRKITRVSSVKLPAPSVARPMIVISPPAPEVGGNVTVTPTSGAGGGSEEHTSEIQSRLHLLFRLLCEKKKIRDVRELG